MNRSFLVFADLGSCYSSLRPVTTNELPFVFLLLCGVVERIIFRVLSLGSFVSLLSDCFL